MRKTLISLLIFIFTFFAFSVSRVSAKIISNQKGDVTIAKTEVINDDLFIGAQSAEIDGIVNGDVFIGAQTVKITGTINGNLHVGAQTLDLGGVVKGNVYSGGQDILVTDSNIGGSLLIGGATVNIDKGSVIGGSVLAGAGTLSIDSQVKRSVYAGTGNLTLEANAKIGKDFYYTSNDHTNISTGAKIVGSTFKSQIKTTQNTAQINAAQKQIPAFLNGLKFGSTLISFFGALIVGFLYFKFFPKSFAGSGKLVSESFWKSFGVGFLVTICTIPALIILAITIVGLPVAGIALVMLALYSYLAKIVVGLALGTWLYKKLNIKTSTYWAFALGLLAIFILKMIPVVGFLTGLVVFWTGLGALTLRMFSRVE